jgi:hypothetical protein
MNRSTRDIERTCCQGSGSHFESVTLSQIGSLSGARQKISWSWSEPVRIQISLDDHLQWL